MIGTTFDCCSNRAKPKIADYPFTTIVPNLGVWVPSVLSSRDNNKYDDNTNGIGAGGSGSDGLVLCDVPGLIAGAAEGVGLGHAFLRHVERCHVILHLIDITSPTPIDDYVMVNREIQKYGPDCKLTTIPQVVVMNKMDTLHDDDETVERTRQELETKLKAVVPHTRILWISAKEKDGVDELMMRVASFVKKVKDSKLTNV